MRPDWLEGDHPREGNRMLANRLPARNVMREQQRAEQLGALLPSKPAVVRERFASVPLFSGCSKRELKLLAKSAEIEPRATGATLMTEGETGNCAFVIIQGRCRVLRNGRRVAQVEAGGVVGELSMLNREPRNATVVADSPLEVGVIRRREFLALLEASPSITRKLLEALAARVQELDARAPV
jgi:CRP/FNR family transcriptional regulator, cyclic AMP receptor protein